MRFDTVLAIDWSGARGNYQGIAVAECKVEADGPNLVPPPTGRAWRRAAVADWLSARIGRGERLLVGFDFAFAFPWRDGAGYLPGLSDSRPNSAFELWETVDRICARDADFFGGALVADRRIAPFFWTRGGRPEGFAERARETERQCAAEGRGRPESVFKLIGPKQVGKASLAGMRLLAWLRRRHGPRLRAWPFEPLDGARFVCVEIFPRLFLSAAGMGSSKLRDRVSVAQAVAHFGAAAPVDLPGRFTDHEADALVSAAALCAWAKERAPWRAPDACDGAIREGWIFGVGR